MELVSKTAQDQHDQSIHVQPYADMIDKLTYVQKADFAKRALELERDCATYKAMLAEINKERDAWISEYRAARSEVERTKLDRDLFRKERDMFEESLGNANATIMDLENMVNQVQSRADYWYTEKQKYLGRVNGLEEWLTEYRDDLKKGNVYHKNQGIINAINELLNVSEA